MKERDIAKKDAIKYSDLWQAYKTLYNKVIKKMIDENKKKSYAYVASCK